MNTKLTPDDIDNVIEKDDYVYDGVLTIAILTLRNGFKVIGKSACVDPANYDREVGKQLAYQDAYEQIWQLEGYLLRQQRYERELHRQIAHAKLSTGRDWE